MAAKNLFITATGTDAGKTYISALILKAMREEGYRAGYFKAALSGAGENGENDAQYVARTAGLGGKHARCPYIYNMPVSPHLAGMIENNPAEMSVIRFEYDKLGMMCEYVIAEGSGGVVCPVAERNGSFLMLADVMRALSASALIVAGCKLGTINSTVLTAEYLKAQGIKTKGIIFNRYEEGILEDDNIRVIGRLTGLPVIDKVAEGGGLGVGAAEIERLFG